MIRGGLLTPGETANLFGVHPKTLNRWAAAGHLDAVRTLGNHRRYTVESVYRLLGEREEQNVARYRARGKSA